VFPATSAEVALDIARDPGADVMVLDPGLPGMNGFELVRRLRAMDAYHALPVLVFSALEHDPALYHDVGIPDAHVFVKSRHPEAQVMRRLRAVLAARGHV
jgi:DNA-binding response OmpR family regulator